jgi:hypothetical protein
MSAYVGGRSIACEGSEGPVSAIPASDALNAALRTNVVEGLTAVMGRVSHEQQLWAVRSEKRCGVEPAPPLFPLRATVLMPYEPSPSPSLSLLRL